MPPRASKGWGHSVSLTMTKKKPPSQREKQNTPTIPRNTMGRRDAQDSGFITGWLKNRKRGALLKISREPPRTRKRIGRIPQHPCQWLKWSPQSPHTRHLPLPPPLSMLQALMGRPLPLHQIPNGHGNIQGMLKKDS